MSVIQNQSIVFRCPDNLKKEMVCYAKENNLQLSAAIRSACSDMLKREMPELFPRLTVNRLVEIRQSRKTGTAQ